MTNVVERTERGWAAHFIGARNCLFRRNTLLTSGKTRIIISTVGNYQTDTLLPSLQPEEIGANRHYETRVFYAQKAGAYWDANVCCRKIDTQSPDTLKITMKNGHRIDILANDMHEKTVTEISKKMAEGVL